jgi:hypothetical protein
MAHAENAATIGIIHNGDQSQSRRSGLQSFSFADTKSLVSCQLSGYRATYGSNSVGTGNSIIVQCSGAKLPSNLSTGQGGHYRCAWSRINELATWLESSPLLHGDCEFCK